MSNRIERKIRDLTEQIIRDLTRQIKNSTVILEKHIHNLDNSMNECCCEDRKAFNFCNVSTEVEAPILCVNCGGYIEPKDLDFF